AMRVCAVLCAVLLLLSQALSSSHPEGSIIIRNPDIDASWYTGRGIRPVGRFGRKAVRRNEHLLTVTAMFESQ
uniref:Prolactin releasing hormone n=1 Tax=Seriola dumerili TaxID=41447 RepID=A0A3B4TTB5_SERDU